MTADASFVGRRKEIEQLRRAYAKGRHVLIVGPAGIGKTAVLRFAHHQLRLLLCEETSSLRRICEGLERQLGWDHYKLNVIERKNRLLAYLGRRGEPVAFDHVALTPPRVSRFMEMLGEQIPLWIACRSTLPEEIGHVWQHLYKFTPVEIPPLTSTETRQLILEAIAADNIQKNAREHIRELHQMSGGNPRILEELLIELAAREYKMDSSFGLNLLALDREIHELDLAVKAAAQHSSLSAITRRLNARTRLEPNKPTTRNDQLK